MQDSTHQALQRFYTQFPETVATGVPNAEILLVSSHLAIPFPEDYMDFLECYGGGYAGSYAVAGLREWVLASDDWHIESLTRRFKKMKFPGVENWAIFSDDGCGNPIGFDAQGLIWLSDHDSCECVCLERTFEDWLRRWALAIEPKSKPHIARIPWSGQNA